MRMFWVRCDNVARPSHRLVVPAGPVGHCRRATASLVQWHAVCQFRCLLTLSFLSSRHSFQFSDRCRWQWETGKCHHPSYFRICQDRGNVQVAHSAESQAKEPQELLATETLQIANQAHGCDAVLLDSICMCWVRQRRQHAASV
jgi:hypothetical protein